MDTMSRAVSFVVFVCFIAAGLASPATQLPCGDLTTKCEVSNVDITPCTKKSGCVLKIGRNASISFDFTPEFSATELETLVTTDFRGESVSLPGFDKDACKFTACPVQAGKKQTLVYNLQLNKAHVAKGKYDLKWTLWNKADPAQICCFYTKIDLKS